MKISNNCSSLSKRFDNDEKNVALSEQLGNDVYHYHLHVVYVPVVQKEILWSRRCKDPALVGTVKEVIPQISHSKKWPKYKDGKGKWINEYSLLQDRFYEHMKVTGFEGFERGERGSTAEHLEVLDYKIQQDTKRQVTVSARVEMEETKLKKLDEKITVKTRAVSTIDEVNSMGSPSLFGGYTVTTDEIKKLKMLAKKSVSADDRVKAEILKRKTAESERDETAAKLADVKKKRPSISEHLTLFEKFMAAMKRSPRRLMAVIDDIMRNPPEQPEHEMNRKANDVLR